MRRKTIISHDEFDKLMFKRIIDHASKRHIVRLTRQIIDNLKCMRNADLQSILWRIS